MTKMNISRRGFIVTTAIAGGGMALGFYTPKLLAANLGPEPWLSPDEGTELNAWLAINPDGIVTIRIANAEMGNGAFNSIPMMLNEELQADWDAIRPAYADPQRHVLNDDLYGRMATTASMVVRTRRVPLQQLGASARERLREAAAREWGVDRSEVEARDSILSAGDRTGTYGEFASRAAEIQLDEEPAIKTPDQYTLIGTSKPRLDTPAKVNGTATYGIDIQLPGMVYAAVKCCPVPQGKLVSYDFEAIRDRPGVIQVVELKRPDDAPIHQDLIRGDTLMNGVAVVADSWYRAKTALDMMPIEWDVSAHGHVSNDSLYAERRALLDQPGQPELGGEPNHGDALSVIERSNNVITAEYHRPYEAHNCIEPMNCTVSVTEDRVDVWVGSQDTPGALRIVADQTGYDPSQVFVHSAYLGGGLGRRGRNDEVRQAAEIAKQVGRPVKLLWTREEDVAQNPMRPMAMQRFSAALDPSGMPEALAVRTVGESLVGNALWYAGRGRESVPYHVANEYYDNHDVGSHIPTHYLRGVNYALYGFAVESFVDEMAHAGGHDPFEFRLRLTRELPDRQRVLTKLREVAGFRTDLPRGQGMGIALHYETQTCVAACATVSVSRRGQLTVEKITIVADPGHLLDPQNARAQVESCIGCELTSVLRGGADIRNGRVVNTNFDTYPLLRIDEMPEIDIHFELERGERWGGLGEVSAGVVGSSIGNAIYYATGKRIRSTPFSSHDLSWS